MTDAQLPELDARERNYVRVDVSDRVQAPGRVWAYLGSAPARERLRRGRATAAAVIARDYLIAVQDCFRSLGPRMWAQCEPSLDPRGLPVAALTRHELP